MFVFLSLRDWFLTDDFMVVREIFTEQSMTDESRYQSANNQYLSDTRFIVVENDSPFETESVNGAMSPARSVDELSDGNSEEVCYKIAER